MALLSSATKFDMCWEPTSQLKRVDIPSDLLHNQFGYARSVAVFQITLAFSLEAIKRAAYSIFISHKDSEVGLVFPQK